MRCWEDELEPSFQRWKGESTCREMEPRQGITWFLTSIPALQDLAAHGILGRLRAAQVLSINPEAGVVLLYQVAVVADHCSRKERDYLSHGNCHQSKGQELPPPHTYHLCFGSTKKGFSVVHLSSSIYTPVLTLSNMRVSCTHPWGP